MLEFDFDDMLALGINTFIIGITNQTIKNNDDNISLEFYVEEKVREKEPSNFWNTCSTTAVLVSTIVYETATGKHIVVLEDVIMITSNRNNSTSQSSVPPWLAQSSISGYARNCQPRGATPRISKKGRNTLSNMNATSISPTPPNQNLTEALQANPSPIPNMSSSTTQQFLQAQVNGGP
ncbi:hypothetical protein F8M41_021976 [Gigaspora margarita]|uniref:Uncharacterized protein n=1 Tax=Gigaspora margarita TaxID=4874 RepID=A0A8H4AFR4_GIGMA|nr:hypothetical protein F8M41_021976 [Gigaspora margarita]